MKPSPSSLTSMTPGARQKMLAAARRKRDAERDAGMLQGAQRSGLQAAANAMAAYVADVKMMDQCLTTGLIPVRLGNINDGGNIFRIATSLQEGIKWADKRFIPITADQRDTAYGFMQRNFEQTLDLILQHYIDLDGSIIAYRLSKYGDPAAPTRHDNPNATFAEG